MKSIMRSFLVFLMASLTVANAAERTATYSWPVADTPMVKLNLFRGSIRVEPSADNEVKLELLARATGRGAQDWVDRVSVSGNHFGAGLAVEVKHDSSGVELNIGRDPARELHLVVHVPRTTFLDLRSGMGSIEVGNDVKGSVKARTTTGDIFVGRVEGDVKAEADIGNITVSRATGDLQARSRRGDLVIGTILGSARLRADAGSIDVMSSRGGIEAEAIQGDIAAGFSRHIEKPSSLKAQVGNVKVALDPATSVELKARASWGKVHSDLALDRTDRGGSGKRALEGLVNGGGPLLALVAKGGDVKIEGVPTFEESVF